MEPYATKETIEEKTEQWLDIIASYNRNHIKINKNGSALIVVDMQNFFIEKYSSAYTCGAEAIIPNCKRLVEKFREANRPVIFTRHVHHPSRNDLGIMEWWWDGICLEDSPESEITPELSPEEGEKIVFKHRYSAFYNTDLETVLRCQNIDDIVICGTMTNMCCESTARDAYYRDYRVFFPADATGAINEEMHIATLLNLSFGFAVIKTVDQILEEFN